MNYEKNRNIIQNMKREGTAWKIREKVKKGEQEIEKRMDKKENCKSNGVLGAFFGNGGIYTTAGNDSGVCG